MPRLAHSARASSLASSLLMSPFDRKRNRATRLIGPTCRFRSQQRRRFLGHRGVGPRPSIDSDDHIAAAVTGVSPYFPVPEVAMHPDRLLPCDASSGALGSG